MYFKSRRIEQTGCGDLVRVEGVSLNEKIAASSAFVAASAAASNACTTTGDQRTVVLMVTFPGVTAPNFTQTQIRDMFFGASGGRSLDGFWRENSYSKTSASGDVYGWHTLSDVTQQSSSDAIFTAAVNALDSTVDFRNYQRVFILYPFPSNSSYSGLGTIGCGTRYTNGDGTFTASVSWIDTKYLQSHGVDLFAHEGGHNLGLYHANSRDYGTEALGPLATPGTISEYGDYFSTMGGLTSTGHYTARQKLQIGWLKPEDIQTIETGGVYSVSALGDTTPGYKSLKIRRGAGNDAWLWVEYRPRTAPYEENLPSDADTGAVIHYEDSNNADNSYGSWSGTTDLLDFTPTSDSSFYDAPLAAEQIWSDAYTPLSLQVLSKDSNTLTLSVGTESCVTLVPGDRSHGNGNETGTIEIQASSECSWTASSPFPWITITSEQSGTGPSILSYQIDANTAYVPRIGALVIGRTPFIIRQAATNDIPRGTSVSPSSGSGAAATFTLTYKDMNGYKDIRTMRFKISSSAESAGCMIEFDRTYSVTYARLANDEGTGWVGSIAFNSISSIENSRCIISNVSFSQLGLAAEEYQANIKVAFKSGFAGQYHLYMLARDASNAEGEWQSFGTWTAVNEAPSIVSASSSSKSGTLTYLNLKVTDPNGYQEISKAVIIFNSSPSFDGACAIEYDRASKKTTLLNDDGSPWNGQVSSMNDRCRIGNATESIRYFDGEIEIDESFSFLGNFAGEKNIYLNIQDESGMQSGWQNIGSFTAINTPPVISASAPSSIGAVGSFRISASDQNSTDDISSLHASIYDGYTPICVVQYDRINNLLHLAAENMSWAASVPLAEAYGLYNNRCLIESASMSGSASLTLNIRLLPSKNEFYSFYSSISDRGSATDFDTLYFTAAPDQSPVPLSITPAAGIGYTQSFQLNYLDEHGYSDLTSVSMNIQDSYGNCMITYSPQTQSIQIQSDGGSVQSGILGSPGLLRTSRCSLDTRVSSASGSGNILTFMPLLTFQKSWEGEKNITLSATDAGGRSSSGIRGKWTAGATGPIANNFNGDGNPDILWHNAVTGEVAVWFMSGAQRISYFSIGQVENRSWIVAGTADFNNDGSADILWRNTQTGAVTLWQMNGTQQTSALDLETVADLNWTIAGTGDFDNDGKPDIVWRNVATGRNYVWFMNGATHIDGAFLDDLQDLNWTIVGTGDFNGDGKPDIVWRNTKTGDNAIWYMDGITCLGGAYLDPVADLNWTISALSDYDGDGQTDIVWRNTATGDNCIWFMNGIVLEDYASLEKVGDRDWFIADKGWNPAHVMQRSDFNDDGNADILWRNTATGANYVWYMNGATRIGGDYLAEVPDQNWTIAGAGDFNNDGKADIVWRNMATGENAVWFMNGITFTDSAYLETVAGPEWKISGIADFNSDGKDDIVWRNYDTGDNAVWLMNGKELTEGVYLPSLADAHWKLAGTGDFNNDGKADLLWRNNSTGDNAVWLMNGAVLLEGIYLPAVADTHWKIAGCGDLNKDGKADILWRNSITGDNAVWHMDGVTFSEAEFLDPVDDLAWTIAGVNAE